MRARLPLRPPARRRCRPRPRATEPCAGRCSSRSWPWRRPPAPRRARWCWSRRARSPRPRTSRRRRATPCAASWSSAPARSAWRATAARRRRRSWTSPRASTRSAKAASCRMAFAPDYAVSGRFYVYLTTGVDGDFDVEVWEYRVSANPDVADAATARRVFVVAHDDRDQPRRRAARVRARRLPVRRHRRRRAPGRPDEPRAGPRPCCSASSCASTPRHGADAHASRRQAPVPRRRSGRSACATRGGSRSTA